MAHAYVSNWWFSMGLYLKRLGTFLYRNFHFFGKDLDFFRFQTQLFQGFQTFKINWGSTFIISFNDFFPIEKMISGPVSQF